ncbi:MAG: hypothetical protein JXR40_01155 [Pontiellaceae bacterium]|nr:hypothetical protein [Pontiellaceae bacterium]
MVNVLVAVVVAAVLDCVSTYIGTPDLSHEQNPVLISIGLTWSNLVTLKILVSLVAVAAFWGGTNILQTRRKRIAGQSGFRNILSLLIFKEQVSLGKFLFGWPKDWISMFAIACLVITMATISGGFFAAMLNFLKAFRSQSHVIAFWCGTGVFSTGIAIWLTCRFFNENGTVGQSETET